MKSRFDLSFLTESNAPTHDACECGDGPGLRAAAGWRYWDARPFSSGCMQWTTSQGCVGSEPETERKNKGLTPNKAKQLAKLKDELEVQKNVELQRLQKTENLLSGLRNDDVWVDWIKDYGKKVKILNKLDRNARNAEILKYVDKIRVSFNENKRTHKLNIKLELPILTTP